MPEWYLPVLKQCSFNLLPVNNPGLVEVPTGTIGTFIDSTQPTLDMLDINKHVINSLIFTRTYK